MAPEFWEGKYALITGSKGFMATWLERKLIEAGASTWELDAQEGDDIRDYRAMCEAMEGLDVVFHLAAISGVEASRSMGMEAIDINVRGTYTVLEAARQQEKPPIVLVATSNHVYGKQDSLPANEDAPLRQLDTYSASKVCADVLTRAYYHNYGLPTAAVRNTNCFGPHDPHSDHIIPATIDAILRGETPVIKGMGYTKKSYMHVEDTIAAYMRIAELVVEHPGQAWNVADEPVKVVKLVSLVCSVMGWDGGVLIKNQPDDQSDEYLDCSKLRDFGWEPKWAFEDAIRDTVEWMKANRHAEVASAAGG